MSSETRKIIVNLDAVKPSKLAKTKKNIVPKIPPNSIKNELLRKIKQTRQNGETKTVRTEIADEYTDEFCKSIQYLNDVKQKMNSVAKTRKNVPGPSLIGAPTINNQINNANVNNYVHLELPDDLEEHPHSVNDIISPLQTPINNISLKPTTTVNTSGHNQTVKNTYNVDNVVPHGCLKNGIKPCFRNWKNTQTRKNTGFEDNNLSSREQQLQRLKQSFVSQPRVNAHVSNLAPVSTLAPVSSLANIIAPITNLDPDFSKENVQLLIRETEQQEVAPQPKKTFIKKTTIKKHTIGKSTKYRRVGVLLKNKVSRKQVIDAHSVTHHMNRCCSDQH